MILQVNKFLPVTKVEGPGERACIWVQGCSIHCPGCAVPGTWDPEGGTAYQIETLAAKILQGPKVEGLTFLGGEPFDQAEAVHQLIKMLQGSGLSIVVFTGYTLEHIKNTKNPTWHELLKNIDLLIAGPYRQDLADLSRPWVGSSNQRYHFLTPRYKDLEATLHQITNGIEVRIAPDGRVFINGMLASKDLYGLAASFET